MKVLQKQSLNIRSLIKKHNKKIKLKEKTLQIQPTLVCASASDKL